LYSIKQTIPSRINTKSKVININVEYILIILSLIFILFKGTNYYLKNTENINKHVKLLNFNIPYIETKIYEESVYFTNKTSIKDILISSLGLNDITAYKIIGKEVSIFNSVLTNFNVEKPHSSSFKPFSLSNNSIAKMTEAEIEELNQVSEAYDESLKKVLDNTIPEVLIFHTHTTENYAERSEQTTEADFSVVGVGDVLAKELEEGYGISVIHDKTNHSVSYNDSYYRSNETLKKYINEYGDFKLIIDLHRDSVANKDAVTVTMNDKSLAKLMFVTAENSATYEANKNLTDTFFNLSNSLFPNLFRNTLVYEYGATAVNYSLSENMVLLEAGSNINSAQEAKLSAKYFARLVAEYLNGE